MKGLKSPEESGEGHKAVPRRSAGPFDSGFGEGEHGRGPSPYSTSHSIKPASMESHSATSGRGGTGRIGKGDSFKARTTDVEHPGTHGEFEALGRD